MNSIMRTTSTENTKENPQDMDERMFLQKSNSSASHDPYETMIETANSVCLGALTEPCPYNPPPVEADVLSHSKEKFVQSPRVSLERYFGRQMSADIQDSGYLWNTGYFCELSNEPDHGDLWKDRSILASHPTVFESRLKKEAERNREDRKVGHGLGVLFWGI